MEKINWKDIESALNKQEIDTRKRLADTNAEYHSDISDDLNSFIESSDTAKSSNEVIDLEEFVSEVTREVDADTPKEAMKSLRYRNLHIALKAQNKIVQKRDYLQMRAQQLKEILNSQKSYGQISPQLDKVFRDVTDKIVQLDTLESQIPKISPEAFIGLHLKDLKEYKEQLMHGRMVETPYFKKQSKSLMESLEGGRPAFIYGHLGSGKTEMAIEVAHDYLVNLNVQKDFENWRREHEDATEKEQIIELRKFKKTYENNSKPNVRGATSAYLISGSKHTAIADFYGYKTLALEHLNGKEVSEHNKAIEEEIKNWKEENKDLKDDNQEEYQQEYQLAAQRIADIYKEKNFAAGTVVKEVLSQVAQAAKEGKPVIIDEVNAIPHEVLISLNHILTRRFGDMVELPGVEDKISIKKGFAIIFTGNLNQGITEKYINREDMDPALLSRLDLIPHDYLPQETEGSLKSHANKGNAQLFHLMLAMEMDEKSNLNMPSGDIDKLWDLAKFARKTQNIFSGKEVVQFMNAGSSRGEEVILEKSVFSIRDIKRVLETYDAGRSGKTIDQVLWEKFIAQATIPTDQALLYQEARNMGFFPDSQGWKMLEFNTVAEINRPLVQDDVLSKPFENIKRDAVFMDSRQVIELVYGKAPERTIFPEMVSGAESNIDGMQEESQLLSDEQINSLIESKQDITEIINKFERVGERICTNENRVKTDTQNNDV